MGGAKGQFALDPLGSQSRQILTCHPGMIEQLPGIEIDERDHALHIVVFQERFVFREQLSERDGPRQHSDHGV